MNYQQFVSAVEQLVKQQISDNMSVGVHTTLKNNGKSRVGIIVSEKGMNVSPTIYLEEYFEQFQREHSLDTIVKSILKLYQEIRVEQVWDTERLQEYACVRSKVVYKLIHAEENTELLEQIPYIPYLDLAIVFYILLDANRFGTASILLTNELMELWGVEKEELYKTAHQNTKRLLAPEFRTMQSVVKELMGEQEQDEEKTEDFMYVLTNRFRSFGAACILYDGFLETVGNQLEENFYVLPSSVHEVIIVPESKSPNRVDLEEMIEEINHTQVEEEEILSNRAYYFSRKENRLIL